MFFNKFSTNKSLSIKTGIDLTAMVDVVLLIIIFFLTTSSFQQLSEIKVDLPSSNTSEKISQSEIIISVTSNGEIYYSNQLISINELNKVISEMDEKAIITIHGDRTANYEKIITVMDAIKQAGGAQISLTVK